jgi:protein TonB
VERREETLTLPLWTSLALHASVVAALSLYAFLANQRRSTFGEKNTLGGGTVGVTLVNSIPLPPRLQVENRVARDTPNETAPKVDRQEKVENLLDDDGVALTKRKRKPERTEARMRGSYLPKDDEPRVNSNVGRAASTPMLAVQNAGNMGTGNDNPFGDRFGWYAKLLRDRLAQHWRTNDVPGSIRTLPPAIVTFEIARDGSVSDGSIQVLQSSGNYALDNSARRAVLEARPLPALPAQFERNTAKVEFWFELKR